MLYTEIISLVQLWPWPGLGGTRPWPWRILVVELTGLVLRNGALAWEPVALLTSLPTTNELFTLADLSVTKWERHKKSADSWPTCR